jgi:hypothetical protein
VVVLSKEWVCGCSLAEIVVSNLTGEQACLYVVSIVCCQVKSSASGWSLFQRNPTDCGVSECDHETSIMRRSWTTRGCCAIRKKYAFMMCKRTTTGYCKKPAFCHFCVQSTLFRLEQFISHAFENKHKYFFLPCNFRLNINTKIFVRGALFVIFLPGHVF